MECKALDHWVHTISEHPNHFIRCCMMSHHKLYNNVEEMESDPWNQELKDQLSNDIWPTVCARCELNEKLGNLSGRQRANRAYPILSKVVPNYLIVNISEGNKCNAACQTCFSHTSSLFAKIHNEAVVENSSLHLIDRVDPKRIVALSFSGGEPSISAPLKNFLRSDLSKFNLEWIRISSNGTTYFAEVERLLALGLAVFVAISIDGVNETFEYSRWPIKWDKFTQVMEQYQSLRIQYSKFKLNFHSVLTCFDVINYDKFLDFVDFYHVELTLAPVQWPEILQLKKTNFLTLAAKERLLASNNIKAKELCNIIATEQEDSSEQLIEHIKREDAYRNISFNEYYQKFGLKV